METIREPKISLNLDTSFLKLIAIICMVSDHVAKIFFPANIIMLILGRVAFPLFAYCLVVGCIYTRNIKKYLIRLSIFALISQPFFVMAFHPAKEGFIENIFVLNIFFTLLFGVLTVYGLMDIKKRWWLLVLSITAVMLLNLDYGINGIVLMIVLYLCRNKRWLSAIIVSCLLVVPFFQDSPFKEICGLKIGIQGFAILSMPLIYIRTKLNLKVNKYIFYIFYPAHLFAIFLFRIALGT